MIVDQIRPYEEYTILQIAQLTNRRYETIWRHVKRGKLKATRPEGAKSWIIRGEDFTRWFLAGIAR